MLTHGRDVHEFTRNSAGSRVPRHGALRLCRAPRADRNPLQRLIRSLDSRCFYPDG